MPSAWLGSTSVHIKVIGVTQPGFEPTRFGFPDLPTWEMGALLIRPSRLVTSVGLCSSLYVLLYGGFV